MNQGVIPVEIFFLIQPSEIAKLLKTINSVTTTSNL